MPYYEKLENGRFKCTQCPKTYSSQGGCHNHFQNKHLGRTFDCEICDYKATSKRDLQKHIRTHTGEKPFKCEFCDYKARDKSALHPHMRTHTGEKPFKCEFCDYKATTNQNLQTHISNIHYKTTHECLTCHHEFTQYGNLRTHLKKGCLGKSSKSRMELLVSKFLDQHNVIATYNKMDEWMVEQTGFRGRFDFVVDIGDPLFIELDGRQHFEPVEYFGGQKTFERQQRHDAVKNKFCRDNGFKLLRFRYDDTNEYIIGTIMLHLGMF